MKFYLIRHGQVENPEGINYGSLPGFHLSEKGREQIAALASDLQNQDLLICAIISSPLERAQETAAILSHALNAPVKIDDRLTEWNMGEWAGRSLSEFQQQSGYYSPIMNTQGMEPLDTMADRVMAAIQDAVQSYQGNIIICSHREPMASALIKLQHLPWSKIHEVNMPKASVTKLEYKEGGISLIKE